MSSYPLRLETLTAGMLFYALSAVLFATYSFSNREAAFAMVWLAMSAITILAYTAMLFDYGMEILRATAEGKNNPPVFSASSTRIGEGWRRCLRQLIVVGLFAAVAGQLNSMELVAAAWAVWLVLFLLLPAFFTNNTIYDSILVMLNPGALFTTVWNLGWTNMPILGLQVLMVALTWICFTGPVSVFLLLFPLVLYCYFLFFHLLGLRVYARRHKFFVQVDFTAHREQTKAISANLADLNRELSEVHEWMRAGDHVRVMGTMEAMLRRRGWDDFEQLFGYTSQWFDSGPAVYLCRQYLDNTGAIGKPMRAFELAQWALKREPGLTLTRADALQTLADAAVTVAQYRTVLHLIENHLKSHPDLQQRAELMQLAIALAGEKLKDEVLYARLKATLQSGHQAP